MVFGSAERNRDARQRVSGRGEQNAIRDEHESRAVHRLRDDEHERVAARLSEEDRAVRQVALITIS